MPIHDIINYSTSICPFEFGKCEEEDKKLQKIEYFEKKKSLSDQTYLQILSLLIVSD